MKERTHSEVFPLNRPGMSVIMAYAMDAGPWGGRGAFRGAYWVPKGDYEDRAEAFLGVDGTARVFLFEPPRLIGRTLCKGERILDAAGDIERGKDMPQEVREALEEAIIRKLMADQAASLRPNPEDGPRDQWGNLIEGT